MGKNDRKDSANLNELIFIQEHQPSVDVKILEKFLVFISLILVIAFFPFSLLATIKYVFQYQRAVVMRLGKLRKCGIMGPGLIFFIPYVDTVRIVDLRIITFEIPSQEVLTKDSCTVYVDAVVFFSVDDPISAVMQIDFYEGATMLLAATILRSILGHKTLTEILTEREGLAASIREYLDVGTEPWGVWVERVEITNVQLPKEMQRAMAAEAEATREARGKVISAQGELRAAKDLKEASDVISESATAIQLRYLQTMSTIASEKKSTILFPLPVNLMSVFQ